MLLQFSLKISATCQGLEELKGTGLRFSSAGRVGVYHTSSDDPTLRDDEEPLEAGDLELALVPPLDPESDSAAAVARRSRV